jgi:micrococcal nuclease
MALSIVLFVPRGQSAPQSLSGEVLRVYDGDTIFVETVGKVRLIGVDAPEWEGSDRDNYYTRKGISAAKLRQISTLSREFVTRNAKGNVVTLTFDRDLHDRHDRHLAYVYLSDGRLLNRLLLEAGLASVYRRFDFNFKSDFIQAEKIARRRSLGLWSGLKERIE